MERFTGWFLMLSLLISLGLYWNRNNFDSALQPSPEVLKEPIQRPTQTQTFQATVDEETYEVYPKFEYVLSGLVVSYRHHNSKYGLHKAWNDHLNIADVCVVWGGNVTNIDLNELEFRNAQFTCYVSTQDLATWQMFDRNKLSNNHLISDNPVVRKQIQDLEIGDQIYIRGFLAEYGQNGNVHRGTSTVRTDTGNGACETIYVKQFHILQEGSNVWRTAMYFSFLINLILAFIYFRQKPIMHRHQESETYEQIDADRI